MTIRKSYSKRFPTQVLETSPPFLVETSREFESKIETLMTLNSKLSARNKVLEDSQRILTEKYEEEIADCENLKNLTQ